MAGSAGSMNEDEFKDVLLDAVDYGLLVLGEIVRQTLYDCLERNCQLKRANIPEKLEPFHVALAGLFGERGTLVERLIARRLYSKLGLKFEAHEDWTLVDYVSRAKKAVPVG